VCVCFLSLGLNPHAQLSLYTKLNFHKPRLASIHCDVFLLTCSLNHDLSFSSSSPPCSLFDACVRPPLPAVRRLRCRASAATLTWTTSKTAAPTIACRASATTKRVKAKHNTTHTRENGAVFHSSHLREEGTRFLSSSCCGFGLSHTSTAASVETTQNETTRKRAG